VTFESTECAVFQAIPTYGSSIYDVHKKNQGLCPPPLPPVHMCLFYSIQRRNSGTKTPTSLNENMIRWRQWL